MSPRSPRRRAASGAVTVIDGYQAVGTIPVDVRALGIDVYIGGCLKWLCGGPGAAFLWVDPELRRRLEPKLTGWMSHQNGRSRSSRSSRRDDAWRFLHGTPNIPASVRGAARPGDRQRGRDRGDPGQVVAANGPASRSRRSGGIPLHDPARPGAARRARSRSTSRTATRFPRSLKARDILCDYRPGAGIRLSPHFYNRDDELDAAIAAIREIRATGRWRASARGPGSVT